MTNFQNIIDLWPSRIAFAEDIGVSPQAVTNMVTRDSVPARYWIKMVNSADRRCIGGINLATLAIAASKSESSA